jgi:hypothetical protein
MKKLVLASSLLLSTMAFSHNEVSENELFHKSTINCGKEGCSVVCHEPGARWDTFLKSEGDIEVTYFFASGTKQLKADVGNGEYTILDTNPTYQSCRITGVVK